MPASVPKETEVVTIDEVEVGTVEVTAAEIVTVEAIVAEIEIMAADPSVTSVTGISKIKFLHRSLYVKSILKRVIFMVQRTF